MGSELRVAFIGAGDVNFGGGEGPWDHASRLERIEGIRLVGVADPDTDNAARRLEARSGPMYEGVRVFGDYRRMLEAVGPDAVWIGVPPHVHGTLEEGHDIEARCAEAGVHLFVEKPLSASRPEKVRALSDALLRSGVLVSVGYMFRYSRAVSRMKEIIADAPGPPRAFLARYACAYSGIRKTMWWDSRTSGGPIVEQATHFADLARYLMGEPALESVRAVQIPATDPAGALTDMPRREDGTTYEDPVPPEFRAPRATAALWQFESGAVGSLTHGVLLHGKAYHSEIEVWGDGLRLALHDPYGVCRLEVRRPGGEATTVEDLGGDDPYLAEDRAFIEAIRSGNSPPSGAPMTTRSGRSASPGPSATRRREDDSRPRLDPTPKHCCPWTEVERRGLRRVRVPHQTRHICRIPVHAVVPACR
jgi:predicted dehydrogenase